MNKPPQCAVMALDWGSQSVRCAIFDTRGQRLAYSLLPMPATRQSAADYQQMLWEVMAATHHQCADAVTVSAIAVCAQRSGLVSIDEAGVAQDPALFWHDSELADPAPQAPWWVRLGCTVLGRGSRLHLLLRQAPSNRLRSHHFSVWQQSRWLLPWSAFLNWCLCGQAGDGISGATGIYPFDFRRWCWRRNGHWTWHALSAHPHQMPALFSAGATIGHLTALASQATGLPPGIPIAACGADKAAEALGAGATTPGALHVSLGTAVTINRLVRGNRGRGLLRPAFPSLTAGISLHEYQLDQGMRVVSALARLSAASSAQASAKTPACYADLERWLARHLPQDARLLCYPEHYPQHTEQWLPQLLSQRSLRQVYPAMMSGLAYTLAEALVQVERASWPAMLTSTVSPQYRADAVTPLLVSGGGSRSLVLTQLLAQVLQRPLAVASDSECGLRGAAMCASVAAGWYPQPKDAIALCSDHQIIHPDRTQSQLYAHHYQHCWRPHAKHSRAVVDLASERLNLQRGI